jgi:hypothetical protein
MNSLSAPGKSHLTDAKQFKTVLCVLLLFWALSGLHNVDGRGAALHDSFIMNITETQASAQRRSSRVFTRITVRAQGKASDGRKFREASHTIVINAHGGLIYLQEELELGAEFVLTNPITEEEQECRVVYLGDISEKGRRVGVEFLSPSPHFWGVEFAQQDWTSPAPPRPVN